MRPVLCQRRLRLIITVDGTIGIDTEAITTDITTAAITICTGPGLSASADALDIIAIGKQYYCGAYDANHYLPAGKRQRNLFLRAAARPNE